MSQTFSVPELGEGIDAVDVVAVLIEVGDQVEVDQPVIEVETDKATVEVPSTIAGTVDELFVQVGDTLGADSPVFTVTGSVKSEPELAEPDAAIEVPDPSDVPTTSGEAEPAQTQPPEPQAQPSSSDGREAPSQPISRESSQQVPAGPSVRRFAREIGVDITQVSGSGPAQRLSIEDVKEFARRQLSNPGGFTSSQATVELPDFSRWGEIEEREMSKVRRLTAQRMERAWQTIPQVTHHDLADVTDLENLRQRFKDRVETAGGKLTVTAMLVKIVASALRLFPDFNSSIDSERSRIIRKHFVNIGVAVDTPRGLLVPVIAAADTKNIKEIAVELKDLSSRARDRKVRPEELQGATFSISNLGGIGGSGFSPIVNWPEVAILGVSRSRMQSEWNGSEFEPRLMLPLSLSYDHRLIDGAEAARFLRWIADALEEPMLLALEG